VIVFSVVWRWLAPTSHNFELFEIRLIGYRWDAHPSGDFRHIYLMVTCRGQRYDNDMRGVLILVVEKGGRQALELNIPPFAYGFLHLRNGHFLIDLSYHFFFLIGCRSKGESSIQDITAHDPML